MTRAGRLRGRLRDDSGFTLVELLITVLVLGIVMAGLMNVFVSGTRAASDADARFRAQQGARLALDRFRYEGRCSSAATLVSGGAGVTLTLPSQCSHAAGTVSWCVVAGVLNRYPAAGCSGTGTPYVKNVTSATPFSLPTPASGWLPQIGLSITVNVTGRAGDGFTLTDLITLRNGTRAP